jgi:NADH dehydrogenase
MMGTVMQGVQGLTLGAFRAPITRDQVQNLRNDNVVGEGVLSFADLGITPTAMEAILPEYLWPYRPSGQYDEITASAKNLKA